MNARVMRIYMIASLLIWVGIMAATTLMLSGTGYLVDLIIILAAGAFFYLVLLPGWFRTLGERSTDQ